MTCGIYKITRKDTGQSYIGLSGNIEKRYYQHSHGDNMKTSRIDPAMVKHGIDKFDLEIIEELPYDMPLLMERERYWIAYYNTYEDDFHYNLTRGGEAPMCGRHHTDVTKKKISKKTKGINNPMYGKHHTIESIKKMSISSTGKRHKEEDKINMSRQKNSTGYYRVYKRINTKYKQGFIYAYQYYNDDNKRAVIQSVDINKLEEKVKSKGLPWYKLKD